MFMFYKIDNDYYILVGSKYMQVKFETKGKEINAVPTGKEIERNPSIKVVSQPFDEEFKKQVNKKQEETNISENKERPRFGRDR